MCILFFTLAVMMNIPSLHMMNIIPHADSILSASSASPSLDQMAAAAATARLLHSVVVYFVHYVKNDKIIYPI